MINISIEKKDLWMITAIFIFLVALGFVIAWDSANPQLHGHTANEILGISGHYVPSDIKATSSAHNGKFADTGIGYDEMQVWIESNGCPDYHVCTVDEIVAYMSETGIEVPEGWLQGAGSREWHRDGAHFLDCKAWTSNAGLGEWTPQAAHWESASKAVDLTACSTELPVLCCK